MDFINRHRKIFLFLTILFCIISIFVTINYRKPTFLENLVGYVIVPSQKVSTNVSGWLGNRIDFISNLNELEEENKKLKEEVDSLKMEIHRLPIIEKENAELRKLLELKEKSDFPTIGAKVIAKDSNNWNSNFIIDVGTKDGIYENMVVTAGDGGLVGKIVKSNANSSIVMPIIDDLSTVNGMSMRSEDYGFVKGDLMLSNNGLCKMVDIDIDAEILVTDSIITSNLSSIYPEGILIGHVTEITPDADGLTKSAVIQPAVDFKHLKKVLVIKKSYEKKFIE